MLSGFAALAERISHACGRFAGWLAVACVLLVFGLVLVRYGLGLGSIAAQEAVLWLHAGVFLLGLSWTLARDGHVRVDLYRTRWSNRSQAWVDLVGLLALVVPFCLFTVWISAEYVGESWRIGESSREPGGLPALYLLKSLIPLSFGLLAVQALASAVRAAATLRVGG